MWTEGHTDSEQTWTELNCVTVAVFVCFKVNETEITEVHEILHRGVSVDVRFSPDGDDIFVRRRREVFRLRFRTRA